MPKSQQELLDREMLQIQDACKGIPPLSVPIAAQQDSGACLSFRQTALQNQAACSSASPESLCLAATHDGTMRQQDGRADVQHSPDDSENSTDSFAVAAMSVDKLERNRMSIVRAAQHQEPRLGSRCCTSSSSPCTSGSWRGEGREPAADPSRAGQIRARPNRAAGRINIAVLAAAGFLERPAPERNKKRELAGKAELDLEAADRSAERPPAG